tara:strand:- start:2896 stop:5196 length:2301 start_codon:yes stop_codon:yes gene_type:complete
MNKDQIKGYDFDSDILPPTVVMDHLRAHDNRMDDEQPYMALAKASYTTRFWEYIEGQEDTNSHLGRFDQVEVNRLKPALSGYLANLYPRRMKVIVGRSPYTTGDTDKAAMLVNDWINQPIMRERVLSASRQALLYKGAGAKIGYDPAEEGMNRVWMRVFPYWEMVVDSDVHDWDDARFIGHVSYQPKQEIIEKYGLSEGIGGTTRDDYLGHYHADAKRNGVKDENATDDASSFVRVLEFCNLTDDYYDVDGTRYKGRLEIYVIDGYDGDAKPVYMGPLPLLDGHAKPLPHIVPLIFEHEPEYPYRGIAYAEQLLPQQKELNTMRSYLAQSARRDARVYLTPKGALDADAMSDLRSGEDGSIIEVDEQYAGNLGNVVVPLMHGPTSSNILNSMNYAETDFDRGTTISPAALGQVTKATASEVMAIEGHTQSEFGRHAEQRDLFLIRIVERCLAAHVASLYDVGDSEGAEQDLDAEGKELSDNELDQKREDKGVDDKKEFEPHAMHNPETGEEEFTETEDEHLKLSDEGWGHDKIKPVEDEDNELDEDDSSIIDLASKVEPEREATEQKRTKLRLVLLDNEGELVDIQPEDIDSDFDIGFSEAGRSPLSRIEMRNNVLQLSDRMLSLLQVSQEAKGEMSALAIEMYKTIHEQFEFPPNLSYDYIKGQAAITAEEEPEEMMPGQQEQPGQQEKPAAPEGAPPEQPSPEQMIEQIRQLPPAEALDALEQVLSKDPEALKLVQQAKQLPPEGQAQAVELLLEALEGGGDAK